MGERLGADQRPQLVEVDRRTPELLTRHVEVTHAHLAEVSGMAENGSSWLRFVGRDLTGSLSWGHGKGSCHWHGVTDGTEDFWHQDKEGLIEWSVVKPFGFYTVTRRL